jgi:RND family efflux transporter MFP subunit
MVRRATCSAAAGLVLAAGVALAGCSSRPAGGPPGAAAGPAAVTVAYPLQREVTDYGYYTGQTAAIDAVQLMPRVTGYLDRINFREGTEVKQGTVLYEIDPRPYQATSDADKALVAQNEASYDLAQQNNKRAQTLNAQHPPAIAAAEVDQYRSQLAQALAALNQSRANLEQARLNLQWTKVRSPIDGLTGQTLVTRGNLVVADQTVLTTLVSQDPMYAYFDVDEPTVLRVRQLIREGKLPSARSGRQRIPVFLGLSNEPDYPHEGSIDFINNQLTPTTGTLQLRGVFPNPRPRVGPRVLAPGEFVRIRVTVSPRHLALLVSQDALGVELNANYVYVVNAQDRVESRNVTLGTIHEGLQEIDTGLEPEDRVIVSGIQHVHPGVTVKPTLVPMPIPQPGQRPVTPPAVLATPNERTRK